MQTIRRKHKHLRQRFCKEILLSVIAFSNIVYITDKYILSYF